MTSATAMLEQAGHAVGDEDAGAGAFASKLFDTFRRDLRSRLVRGDHGMTLGKILRQKREERGLSLRDLEKITGVYHSTIGKIERGAVRAPAFEDVVRIAKALGLKLASLAKVE
jgi:ribosome-binding protein aMBF1 (putative translation factor)